ncbi:NAD-dependent epimerase/dehydratase family protein [Shewanella algae]|uniref:NAD-dependent epimerase/dehydratase family protein n=1 Tax=Shewanella algae TaxID=38313 RepID=UPI0031F51BE9
MKFLLTGTNGFIGSKLLSRMSSIYGEKNIVILSSRPSSTFNTIVYDEFFNIPDHDKEKLKSIDVVIHVGAYTPKNSSQINDLKGCNSNIFFTEFLLNLNIRNLKKIIYFSTLDVYECQGVISEDSRVNPNSLYGMSKYYCERLILEYSKQHNIQCKILRVGHVYGPGEENYQKLIPVSIKKISTGKMIELWGDGNELRSYIYVDDVVSACLNAIELNVNYELFNIVSSKAISILELLNIISLILDKPLLVKKIDCEYTPVNFTFNNTKMKRYLLDNETDIISGLTKEIDTYGGVVENNF